MVRTADLQPSIWQLEASSRDYPSLNKSINSELVIVGGGIVGLSTAIHLREQGYEGDLVLLEAKSLGFWGLVVQEAFWLQMTNIYLVQNLIIN